MHCCWQVGGGGGGATHGGSMGIGEHGGSYDNCLSQCLPPDLRC